MWRAGVRIAPDARSLQRKAQVDGHGNRYEFLRNLPGQTDYPCVQPEVAGFRPLMVDTGHGAA